jgi:hypothetical protein
MQDVAAPREQPSRESKGSPIQLHVPDRGPFMGLRESLPNSRNTGDPV